MNDPILIVGAGPTGLTAALELSRFGIPVRLVDQNEAPATTSRALGIQARTMELLEQRGLAEAVMELGNPAPFGSIYGDGKRLVRIDFGTVRSRYKFLMNLSQAETERILREAIEARGIRIEWNTRMVGFEQDPHGHGSGRVSATLCRPDGGLERVRASWLIGAEGAHSTVRTTLDLGFEGKTNPRRYMLGDVRVEGDLAATDFHIFGSEHGFLAMFPLGEGHFRLIADNPPDGGQQVPPPSLDDIQRTYDQRSAIPARFHDLGWSSWFRINSRMVDRLRVGQLFLGGDAAHIHAPAGAQGMNTGMQDMINLCWKLALHVRGQAPAALLDSYALERLPVIRGVLNKTETITGMIGAEGRLSRMLIDHVAPLVGGVRAVQSNTANHMAQIEYGYRDSPLSVNHHPGGRIRAGDRVPETTVQFWAPDWTASRLLPLLDPTGFVLLAVRGDGSERPDPTPLASALSAACFPIPIREIAAVPGNEKEFHRTFGDEGTVLLVRPDGYVAVAAGGGEAPETVRRWCAHWLAPQQDT